MSVIYFLVSPHFAQVGSISFRVCLHLFYFLRIDRHEERTNREYTSSSFREQFGNTDTAQSHFQFAKFRMGGMVDTREYMFSRSSARRAELHVHSYMTGGMCKRDSPATSNIFMSTVRSMPSAVSCVIHQSGSLLRRRMHKAPTLEKRLGMRQHVVSTYLDTLSFNDSRRVVANGPWRIIHYNTKNPLLPSVDYHGILQRDHRECQPLSRCGNTRCFDFWLVGWLAGLLTRRAPHVRPSQKVDAKLFFQRNSASSFPVCVQRKKVEATSN